MASVTNVIIQGTTYKSLVPNNENYFVEPFDANGNLFPQVTLNVDTTTSATTIFLPEIATLQNNWNVAIEVCFVADGASNNIPTIGIQGSDTIGSLTSLAFPVAGVGANAICKPVSETSWSVVYTK